MKIIFTLLFNCSMLAAFTQSYSTDSVQQNAPYLIGESQVTFTMAQQMPNYKEGIMALADTLTAIFERNKETATNKTLIGYKLRITDKGMVDNVCITMCQNDAGLCALLQQALFSTSGMWESAKQNGVDVNAFKSLVITIVHHKINIKELH